MIDTIPVLKQEATVSEFDSSLKEQTYILSYEGRNWHISEFMYHILALIDGVNNIHRIADLISERYDKKIGEQEIWDVIYGKFAKTGIIVGEEAVEQQSKSISDFLWCKINLIKSETIMKFKFLSVLYNKRLFIVLVVLGTIIPGVLIVTHYNSKTFQSVLETDGMGLLYFLTISLVIVLIHEFGHMAACMRFGIRPGNIGFAFYFIQPVMYSDVSKSWQLTRKQRALIDLGGVYLESMALTVIWLIGYFTGNSYITLFAGVLSIALIMNFNPFIKMDGYWVFSDLSGIPNLHKMMSGFVKAKIYAVFGIKLPDVAVNIRGIEKTLFYVYVITGILFIFFFAYGFLTAFVSLFLDWQYVMRLFDISRIGAQSALGAKLMLIGQMIYRGIVYVVTVVLLVRITFVTLKSIQGFVITLYRDVTDIKRTRQEFGGQGNHG